MIIYIYGDDAFRSRRYLKEQVEKFRQTRDPGGYNSVFVDAKKETLGKIISETNAMPFLAERRLVVLENLLAHSSKEVLKDIAERVVENRFPETNVIIFWQGEAKSRIKEAGELEKILLTQKYRFEAKSLKGLELSAWIKEELNHRRRTISRDAVAFLTLHAEGDTARLNGLLDQFVAYTLPSSQEKAAREITLADVQLFLEEKIDDTVFALVDAVVAGNRKTAFKLLAVRRNAGEDDGYIFAMLVRQFRILLMLNVVTDASSPELLAKELGLHPFVVKKSLPHAKRFSSAVLKKIYDDLLQIEIKTKTGAGSQGALIDRLVCSL